MLVLNFLITSTLKQITYGSSYHLLIYVGCSESKVQRGAARGNEVSGIMAPKDGERVATPVVTTRRMCHSCGFASTSISIPTVTTQCLPRQWMFEPVMQLQWLQNDDPNWQKACHCVGEKYDEQNASYRVVQSITNRPSWSSWWYTPRKTKNTENGWQHLSYPRGQTWKIYKMEAQLNILPARVNETVWHALLQ
jgi:hypothetical protein